MNDQELNCKQAQCIDALEIFVDNHHGHPLIEGMKELIDGFIPRLSSEDLGKMTDLIKAGDIENVRVFLRSQLDKESNSHKEQFEKLNRLRASLLEECKKLMDKHITAVNGFDVHDLSTPLLGQFLHLLEGRDPEKAKLFIGMRQCKKLMDKQIESLIPKLHVIERNRVQEGLIGFMNEQDSLGILIDLINRSDINVEERNDAVNTFIENELSRFLIKNKLSDFLLNESKERGTPTVGTPTVNFNNMNNDTNNRSVTRPVGDGNNAKKTSDNKAKTHLQR